MTSGQRRKRSILGAGCLLSVCMFIVLGLAFATGPGQLAGKVVLLTAWWVSAILGLVLGVAACRVDDDGAENPEYLGSLLHGLAAEWRRGGHTS